MADEQVVSGWVWPSNVRQLCFWLSHYVGYKFDEWDWDAIAAALPNTDADSEGGWYEYPLSGEPLLTLHLARNTGASPVSVRVVGPLDALLAARAETLLDVFSDVRPVA